MILVCLLFRLVFSVNFFQIDTSGSFLVAFLPSVVVLSHKALRCVPNVLIALSTHLLYFCSMRVEVGSSQGLRESSHDVSVQPHHHRSIA